MPTSLRRSRTGARPGADHGVDGGPDGAPPGIVPGIMSDTVSARQVETLSLRAWPALRTDAYDGWVLRFGGGYTRRANSVNPLDRGLIPLADKIVACERAFQAEGLPIVFRIPSISADTDVDAALAVRGYAKSGKTSVRLAGLAAFTGDLDGRVELAPRGSD